jgi:hypothetical protein
MKFRTSAIAAAAAALLVAPVAQAQEQLQHEVGAWKIIAVFTPSGGLNRCLADLTTAGGKLRLHYYANNNWDLTIPGTVGAFKQKPNSQVWTEFGTENRSGSTMLGTYGKTDATAARLMFHGINSRIPEIRRATKLSIKAFPGEACDNCPTRTFSWNLTDIGAALDDVVNCVAQHK